MSSTANPQHEPTMEEILASIRKIISEDQQAAPAKPAPAKPLAAPPKPPEPVAAVPAAPELDILELTEEVKDDQPAAAVQAVQPEPAPIAQNDVAFETIEEPPQGEPAMDNDLISDSTRHAVGRAFANLNGESSDLAPKGGSLEAIFTRAIQDAFQPVLQEWVDANSTEVMENLKPLIRAWMDENLPPLIEAAVVKEIARSADRARKR